jgi:hypothetical protein
VLHVLVVERAPQVGPLGDLHWVHACARQFRPEGDLEPALVSAVTLFAEGVVVAGAVDDDEELERLGGHRGRGRGGRQGGGQRETTIAGPGPVRATNDSPLLSPLPPIGPYTPTLVIQRVTVLGTLASDTDANADAHLLAPMSGLSLLVPVPQ